MTCYIILVCIALLVVVSFLDSLNHTIIYPVYLFNFFNKQIDDDFKIKELDEKNILIDDDGSDIINLEDLKKLRKEEKLMLLYIRYSLDLESYLSNIFKHDYIVLCQKISKLYNPGDFIVVKHIGNYYIREVVTDENKGRVLVYKPDGKNTEYVDRMDIIGRITSYNKYKIGWA